MPKVYVLMDYADYDGGSLHGVFESYIQAADHLFFGDIVKLPSDTERKVYEDDGYTLYVWRHGHSNYTIVELELGKFYSYI